MSSGHTEAVVEQAGLAWIEIAGWWIRNDTGIAPGESAARCYAHGPVVMARRLRESLLLLACSDLRRMAAARLPGRTV
jgi:hypothetical protein